MRHTLDLHLFVGGRIRPHVVCIMGRFRNNAASAAASCPAKHSGIHLIVHGDITSLGQAGNLSIPKGIQVDLPDGEYEIEVQLTGGSGRASVTSPAILQVQDEKAVIEIEWSSPNYDYMTMDGETYLPVNTEGNSVFELPVTAFDKEVPVTADTTAMSVPHEIEYTILLDSASIANAGKKPMEVIAVVYVAAVIAVSITAWQIHRKRKGKKE